MARDVKINVTATNQAGRVFKDIGTDAERMGRTVESSAVRSSQSFANWEKAARSVGAGLGALTIISTKLANDSEVSQQRLQASIEATGASYEDYADAIGKASDAALQLAFDDEDALDALSALTQGTGDTTKALNDLALVEDIARARGIDLASASKIVIAAEQGRVGSLARLGIAIDANATSEEALAALQTKYAGQAEAYAQTNAATWDRIGNTVENKLEEVGGFLVDFQAPILAVSTAGAALGPVSDALKAIGSSARVASIGMGALNLAMGPVGIGLAAAAGAFAIYELTQRESDSEKQAKALTQATDEYTRSIQDNITALSQRGLLDEADQLKALLDAYISAGGVAQTRIENFIKARDLLLDEPEALQKGLPNLESLDDYTKGIILAADINHDFTLSADEAASALAQLQAGFDLTVPQATSLEQAMTGVTEAMSDPQLFGQQIANQAVDILTKMHDGVISVDEAINQLNALPTLRENNRAFQETADSATNAANAINMVRPALVTWNDDLVGLSEKASITADEMREVAENTLDAATGLDSFAHGADQAAQAASKGGQAAAALDAELADLAKTLETDFAGAAGAAYDRVVGFTSGMVSAIQKTKDWTDALTAPLGTDFQDDGSMSALLDLVQRGKLDQEDYNEALTAQASIYDDLARATDAANIIQVKQIDTVADGADATADYLEHLSKLPEAEQEVALAWADQDLAGRANEIATMGARFGEMSAAQKQAFESMVESAAAADPALATLLESVGLIKRDVNDPTGWQLVIDSSDAESDTDRLTEAITALSDLLAKIYKINIDDSDVTDAAGAVAGVGAALANIDGRTATVYVNRVGLGLSPFEAATGGPIRFATGGVARLAELGPEMLRYPSGAMGMAMSDGLYAIPNGTQVDTAAATREKIGSVGGGLHIHGNVYVTPPTADLYSAISSAVLNGGMG